MVIKTTRWTPDHCKHGADKCIVDYRWQDDGNDNVNKEITFQIFERTCSDHQTMINSHGPKKTFDVILEENQRKNKTLKAFIENDDDVGEDFTNRRGETFRRLKEDLDYEYIFGPIQADGLTRAIEVEFKTKTDKEKVDIKDKKKIEDKLTELGVDKTKVTIK